MAKYSSQTEALIDVYGFGNIRDSLAENTRAISEALYQGVQLGAAAADEVGNFIYGLLHDAARSNELFAAREDNRALAKFNLELSRAIDPLGIAAREQTQKAALSKFSSDRLNMSLTLFGVPAALVKSAQAAQLLANSRGFLQVSKNMGIVGFEAVKDLIIGNIRSDMINYTLFGKELDILADLRTVVGAYERAGRSTLEAFGKFSSPFNLNMISQYSRSDFIDPRSDSFLSPDGDFIGNIYSNDSLLSIFDSYSPNEDGFLGSRSLGVPYSFPSLTLPQGYTLPSVDSIMQGYLSSIGLDEASKSILAVGVYGSSEDRAINSAPLNQVVSNDPNFGFMSLASQTPVGGDEDGFNEDYQAQQKAAFDEVVNLALAYAEGAFQSSRSTVLSVPAWAPSAMISELDLEMGTFPGGKGAFSSWENFVNHKSEYDEMVEKAEREGKFLPSYPTPTEIDTSNAAKFDPGMRPSDEQSDDLGVQSLAAWAAAENAAIAASKAGSGVLAETMADQLTQEGQRDQGVTSGNSESSPSPTAGSINGNQIDPTAGVLPEAIAGYLTEQAQRSEAVNSGQTPGASPPSGEGQGGLGDFSSWGDFAASVEATGDNPNDYAGL